MLTVYAQRRGRLLSLAKGMQVAVFTAPNLFYLTGFFGGGAAVVHRDRTVIITTPLEADRARGAAKEAEIAVVEKWKDLSGAVAKQLEGPGAVADEAGPETKGGTFEANPDLFLEARRVKDESEVERIRRACAGTDKVFGALERELKPGRTEWELAGEAMKVALEQRMIPHGPPIIASGPNGAYGHSELSSRRLKGGDLVVADLFFTKEGYYSDETRTFAVGAVTGERKKHYQIVREAQQAALDAVREGVACGAVHDAAVNVLRRHKVEKYLNHSVGHGVGIDIHELPRIAHGERPKLLANDVVTDEPGLYFVGEYGIRIEDTVAVRGKRPEVLTRFTKDLVTCG